MKQEEQLLPYFYSPLLHPILSNMEETSCASGSPRGCSQLGRGRVMLVTEHVIEEAPPPRTVDSLSWPSQMLGAATSHKHLRTLQGLEDLKWVRTRTVPPIYAPTGNIRRNTQVHTQLVNTPKHIWSPTEMQLAVVTHTAGQNTYKVATAQIHTYTQMQLHLAHLSTHTNHQDTTTPSSTPHKNKCFPPKYQPQPSLRDLRPWRNIDPPPLPPGPARPSLTPREGPAPTPPTYRLWKEVGQERRDFSSPGRLFQSRPLQTTDFSGSKWQGCWRRMGRRQLPPQVLWRIG